MKHLVLDETTNIGNHEITVNDLKQLQEASTQLQDILALSLQSTAQGGVIIAGVREEKDQTNNTISYTRGYIAKDNQLWRVNAMSAQTIDTNKEVYLVYRIENTYSPVTYKSGQSFPVHQERIVDLVYRTPSNQPTGTRYQDYAFLSTDVIVHRLADMIQRTQVNTNHRLMVEQQPWVTLNYRPMMTMIVSGLGGIGLTSQCRYKVIGKQFYLELLLIHLDTIQTSPVFELRLPNNFKIASTTNFSLIAYASLQGTCRVEIKGSDPVSNTGVLRIYHPVTRTRTQNTISFSVVLELEVN